MKIPLEARLGSALWGLVWACCLTPLFFFPFLPFFMKKVENSSDLLLADLAPPSRRQARTQQGPAYTNTTKTHLRFTWECTVIQAEFSSERKISGEKRKERQKAWLKKRKEFTHIWRHNRYHEWPIPPHRLGQLQTNMTDSLMDDCPSGVQWQDSCCRKFFLSIAIKRHNHFYHIIF